MSKHPSQPFNPNIANLFFRAGMIEAWGRGIERIIVACREARSPEPEISLEETGLWITFPFASEGSEEATRGKKPAKTRVKTRVKMLRMIQENPAISARQLAGALGITQKGVEWHLRLLQAGGELRREGPAKGGRWLVSP
jgi:ATP-dependent DNA helicase RecG